MEEHYGESEEQASHEIVAFIKVIEDASNYAFSRNHSTPYSIEGYVCGWLRYHYPLEFLTTALNISIGKEEKTNALINYANKHKISVRMPKYGHSSIGYSFDEKQNAIYHGIGSIKDIGQAAASDMVKISDLGCRSFPDIIFATLGTKVNKTAINKLIDIDYFSEFGGAKKLSEEYNIITKYSSRKTLPKEGTDFSDLIAKTGDSVITDLTKSGKRSDKRYTVVDNMKLIKYLCDKVPDEDYSLPEKVKRRYDALGYLDVVDPSLDWRYAVVSRVNDKYTPRVDLYCLKNGKTTTFKIRKTRGRDHDIKTTWKDLPLHELDIIHINGHKKQNKMFKKDDKWVRSDETEWLLTDYSIIT